ncbi:MAG TPA: conjugal transfer protein TraB [Aquifex aeolicus]|nr:conjugal transfer protein TraB [Aquifex aeolicus]
MKTVKDKLEKRKKLVIGAVFGIFGLSVAGSMFMGLYSLLKTTQTKKQILQKQIQEETKLISEKDWKFVTETRLKELEDRIQLIEKVLREINEKLQERETRETKVVKGFKEIKSPSISVSEKEKEKLPPIKIKIDNPPPIELGRLQRVKQKKEPPQFEEFVQEVEDIEEKKKSEKEEKEKKYSLYIPLGFAKALLLNGVDAPTLQYGRENPHPVLMLLLDKTILANNRKLNLKGCFVMGSAFGELSSERAYIEISRISCIDEKGKIYQKKVDGVIIDADGKTGLKGRLVSKFGSVLAKQFMAGILEGISRILQASSTTVQISPIGTTSTIKPEDITKVSIASGFGSAARKLADFYISLAKEYFPVIEIQAGRPVTILFYGGEKLEETADFNPGIGGRL